MGRQQAESRRVTSKVAQKCCKSKKSVFWHPQRHASSRNIKTFVLPHKTGHLRVDSSHIWTQMRGGLSPIVEMVMGETQSHVSRLGRLRKAPESGQSGPTIDLCEFLGSSLSLEQSTNLSDGVYRHRAPEYPDKLHTCSSCAIPPRVAGGLWSDGVGCDMCCYPFGVLCRGCG